MSGQVLRLVTCEAGDVLGDVRNTKNFLDYPICSLFNRYSGLQSSDVIANDHSGGETKYRFMPESNVSYTDVPSLVMNYVYYFMTN